MNGQRLRLTVIGSDELTLDVDPSDIAADVSRDGSSPDPTEVRALQPSPVERAAGQRRDEVTVDGWVFQVLSEPQARAALRERAGRGAGRSRSTGRLPIRAQIPGRVVRVWVAQGERVEAGQRLLAVEAMKMENEVRTPRAGMVEVVRVAVDAKVELGDELVVIGEDVASEGTPR